jgi:hypothetical protein
MSYIQDNHLRKFMESTGMYTENGTLYRGGFLYYFLNVTCRWYSVVQFGPLNSIHTYNRLKAVRYRTRSFALTFKTTI